MQFSTLVVVLCACAVSRATAEEGTNFLFSAALSEQVTIQWNFDEEQITLQQTVESASGWMGIGFSTSGSMAGADMIMMGVVDGEAYALDTHGERNGLPLVDESQDVRVVGGMRNGTHMTVTIQRKRVTCDENDMKLKESTVKVLWAFGPGDVSKNSLSFSNYHRNNRGSMNLKLINPKTYGKDSAPTPGNFKYFDIRASNFSVPPVDTHYYCKSFKIPTSGKRQIVKFGAVVTPGNERFVHHMTVRLCDHTHPNFEYRENPFECYAEGDPLALGCGVMLTGWAIGVSETVFPDNVGFPFGGPNDAKYVMIEIHYDNPEQKVFADSSGIRFHYTDELRPIDAGILVVHHTTESILVPPNKDRFKIMSHCQAECLAKGLAVSGIPEINVLGTVMHAHEAGRAMSLRHIRNGKELEPIANDENYDNNYQEAQYRNDGEIKVKSGDTLSVQCEYTTKARNNMLTGGLPISDEMCFAFLVYYPRLKLDFCSSSHTFFINDPSSTMELMKQLEVEIPSTLLDELRSVVFTQPASAIRTMAPILNQVNWTAEKAQFLETFFLGNPSYPVCLAQNEFLMNPTVKKDKLKYTEYVPVDECNPVKEMEGGNDINKVLIFIAVAAVVTLAAAKLRM